MRENLANLHGPKLNELIVHPSQENSMIALPFAIDAAYKFCTVRQKYRYCPINYTYLIEDEIQICPQR